MLFVTDLSLLVFGQIEISASTPAWKVCFSPSIVDLFGSVSVDFIMPRLKVSSLQVDTNFTNEPAGRVGI